MKDPYKYFKIEAAELLEGLTRGILELEKKDYDPEVIEHIFRNAHTLKGAASVVKLSMIADHAHKMEDLLAKITEQKKAVQKEDVTKLLNALDSISLMLENIKKGKPENAEEPEPEPKPEQEPKQEQEPEFKPEFKPGKKESFSYGAVENEETIRINSRKMEQLTNFSNEILVNILALKTQAEQIRQPGKSSMLKHGNMEEYMDVFEQNLEQTGLFVQEMNELIMDMRLTHVKKASFIFEKTVRETALAFNKDVDFILKGRDIPIDRSLLNRISEPICHLLRNSVIHGVELPEKRIAGQKSPKAKITLSFIKNSHTVSVVCEDDGQGLDIDRIKKNAVKKKYIDAETANKLTMQEACLLVFKPGLSSARTLTKYAGRGVGLDVVKNTVDAVGGSINIESHKNRFTRFSITLPASINITRAFMVEAGGHNLLIPMSNILETLIIKENDICTASGHQLINYKGQPIPAADLAGIINRTWDIPADSPRAVILEHDKQVIALTVNRLKGKKIVPVKPLEGKLKEIEYAGAVTILGNGEPAFIVSAADIFKSISRMPVQHSEIPGKEIQKSILVADDSLTTRILINGILENEGYEVELAHSGDQAVEILENKSFDLLITDVDMPGINGIELTEQLRQAPGYREMPIVIMTSRGSDKDKKSGLKAGANAYIVKSGFDQDEFLEIIESLI